MFVEGKKKGSEKVDFCFKRWRRDWGTRPSLGGVGFKTEYN